MARAWALRGQERTVAPPVRRTWAIRSLRGRYCPQATRPARCLATTRSNSPLASIPNICSPHASHRSCGTASTTCRRPPMRSTTSSVTRTTRFAPHVGHAALRLGRDIQDLPPALPADCSLRVFSPPHAPDHDPDDPRRERGRDHHATETPPTRSRRRAIRASTAVRGGRGRHLSTRPLQATSRAHPASGQRSRPPTGISRATRERGREAGESGREAAGAPEEW